MAASFNVFDVTFRDLGLFFAALSLIFWEKDEYENEVGNYICNVGKLKALVMDSLDRHIPIDKIARINNSPVFVEIDREEYFYLPLNSEVFK